VVLARLPAWDSPSRSADNPAGGADSVVGVGSPLALHRVKRSKGCLMRGASGMRNDSVLGKKLGALSGVKLGKGKGEVGTQLLGTFIPHIVLRSMVTDPKWPKVCRLTHCTEQSYGVFIVAAFTTSGAWTFRGRVAALGRRGSAIAVHLVSNNGVKDLRETNRWSGQADCGCVGVQPVPHHERHQVVKGQGVRELAYESVGPPSDRHGSPR
jgi:hypothetical protein